jgi:hypothetical protein
MKKFIFSILTLSTVVISCNTDLDINRNPDTLDPNDAELSAQLPAGIVGLAGSEGAGMAIFGGFWAQYWTQSNTANQFKDIDNYSAGTADYNFIWNGMFDALGDIRNIKRRALAEGNWNYYLIATTLEVQASQLLTDFYGDIPYEEASLSSNLTPHFNTGEEVYDLMIADLDDALSRDLSTSAGALPDDHDLIFQGDMDKWTAFANTLKLKIYMRQTDSSRAAIANAGITALLSSGVDFLDEDAGIDVFIDEINQSNPLYEYIERRLNVATNLRASNTLFSFLTNNADTRKPFYYEAGNALAQGDYNSSASNIAVVNLHAETPVYFMTREESLFLQAEAELRVNGGGAASKALYDAAVTENFSRYGLSAAALLAGAYAYPVAGTFDQQLEAIITQKWVSGFPGNGFEGFFDHNRTGYPTTFTYSVTGSTAGQFPRRIVYPLSERNANPNTPALVPITTPVWWD